MSVQLFAYHMRYRLDQIERIVGSRATRDLREMTGIPGLVSVTAPDGSQYDFAGADDANLVLLWIDNERLPDSDEARAALARLTEQMEARHE